MATGLQFKENLTMLSTGYPGEGVGSNGVVQDWTETVGDSGSSTVTYYYHDSSQQTDSNSTLVEMSITDTWSAVRDSKNFYRVTVTTTLNSIRRTIVGSPSPYSVSMFARRTAGGVNLWTSGGCVNAAGSADYIPTPLNLGTYTIVLPPGHSTDTYGTIYFRSNTCGHDDDPTPSIYVDEFWMGLNFRNTLPPDYRPGDTWDSSNWMSHNRAGGWAGIWNGSSFAEMRTIGGDGSTTGNPPYIYNGVDWVNQRLIGLE